MVWGILVAGLSLTKLTLAGTQKIIIDSDYNTLSDDGQLGVMAAQLQAEGKLHILGITVVSGNLWLKEGVAEALKSVERLGVEQQIGIYSGANYPLKLSFEAQSRNSETGVSAVPRR